MEAVRMSSSGRCKQLFRRRSEKKESFRDRKSKNVQEQYEASYEKSFRPTFQDKTLTNTTGRCISIYVISDVLFLLLYAETETKRRDKSSAGKGWRIK